MINKRKVQQRHAILWRTSTFRILALDPRRQSLIDLVLKVLSIRSMTRIRLLNSRLGGRRKGPGGITELNGHREHPTTNLRSAVRQLLKDDLPNAMHCDTGRLG
jgi:hypothetical protein